MDPKIAAKIKRLLRLAEGNENENEAAAAVGQAQRLMEAHEIDQAMLEGVDEAPPEEPIDVWEEPLDHGTGSKHARWKYALADTLARFNGCFVWGTRKTRKGHTGLGIAGRPSDVNKVRYLYAYCIREIDQLAARHRGNGRTWLNNYRLGIVDAINRQLKKARNAVREEHKAAAGGGVALVKVETALAKIDARFETAKTVAYKKQNLRAGSASNARFNAGARARGREDGKRINLGAGKGLGAGRSKLGSGS